MGRRMLFLAMTVIFSTSMGKQVVLAVSESDFADPECPSADTPVPILLPHREECSKFYICEKGRAHLKECARGLHFNPHSRVCDYKDSAKCSKRHLRAASPKCPKVNANIASLLPHESDCNSYYACESGEAILLRCPPNLHFNPSQSVCDYPDRAGCTPGPKTTTIAVTESLTEKLPQATGKPSVFCPVVDGKFPKFFPHLTNCSIYYMCGNGLAYEFVCPKGLHFNVDSNVCDYPHNVGCLREARRTIEPSSSKGIISSSSMATSEIPSSSAESSTETVFRQSSTDGTSTVAEVSSAKVTKDQIPFSTTLPICEGNSHGIRRPHDVYCSKYYACQGDGTKVELLCPEGQHFSSVSKNCEYPADAGCTLEFERRA